MPEWRGDLEDCTINYCALNSLAISNAIIEKIDNGTRPNVSGIDTALEAIPAEQRAIGIFYINAQLFYNCIKGHSFGDLLEFNKTCKSQQQETGFAEWDPVIASCNRMQYCLAHKHLLCDFFRIQNYKFWISCP